MAESFSISPIDWDSAEADEARRIRMEVFVGEQGVPADLELDTTDAIAYHVIARDEAGAAVGTGRLFPDVSDSTTGHVGRMAVVPEKRGTGCGKQIMAALEAAAREQGYHSILLSAQVHAAPFYEKLGYAFVGPEYLDAGIPHRDMRKAL